MAIIKCKKCGSLMSSRATVCPKCGWPTSKSPAEPPTTIAGQKAAPEKAQPQTPVDGSLESNNNFRSEPAAENNQVVEAVAAASNQEAEDAVENNQEVGDVSYLLEEDNTSQELTFAITVLALIVLLGVVFFFTTRHSQGESAVPIEEIEEEEEAYADEEEPALSFERIELKDTVGIYYHLSVLLPKSTTSSARAIRKELMQLAYDEIGEPLSYEEDNKKLKPKAGEGLEDYARRFLKALKAEMREGGYSYGQWEFTIDTLMLTSRFVAYKASGYQCMWGSMHSVSFGEGGMIYRLGDGKRFTKYFKDPDAPGLRSLLIKGLCQYFNEYGYGPATPNNMGNFLSMDPSELPMPGELPSIAAEGMAFSYSMYEIAAGVYGEPSFVIPYDQLEPYLTDELIDLIH